MKKGTSALILFIVFCACCAITFFSLKGLNLPDKEDTKTEEKKKNGKFEVDEKAINDAIQKLKVFEIWGKDINPKDLTNEELIFFVYRNTEDFYDDGISLDKAQKLVDKYLGVTIKKGSMDCPNGGSVEPKLVIFDESSNKFIVNPEHGAHGAGGTALDTLNKIEDIKTNGDEVTVTVKKLFSAPFGDVDLSTIYYYNYKSAMNETKTEAAYEDIDEQFANDAEYDEGINRDKSKIDYSKASTYEYKFKVVDGNYVLLSYKEIK